MTILQGSAIGSNTGDGVNMQAWDLSPLQNGDIIALSSHQVTIHAGDHTYVLDGKHFAFIVDNGHVELGSGIINALTVYKYPPPPSAVSHYDYKISDFHLRVEDFNDFVATNDVAGYEARLFHGEDTLTGSPNRDTLLGLTGRDHLDGLGADDSLDGGRGRDVLIGGAGADRLHGGMGADLFVYRAASESGGGVYDIIDDFNVNHDRLIVPHIVQGLDAAVNAGTSHSPNVDANLAAAFDSGHLEAHHAAIATVLVDISPPHPTTTPQPSPAVIREIFLVVDVNGVAGYQAGEDLAIRVLDPNDLKHLSLDDFISPTLTPG